MGLTASGSFQAVLPLPLLLLLPLLLPPLLLLLPGGGRGRTKTFSRLSL
jgi:hypothetical protein